MSQSVDKPDGCHEGNRAAERKREVQQGGAEYAGKDEKLGRKTIAEKAAEKLPEAVGAEKRGRNQAELCFGEAAVFNHVAHTG